jgi:hypothetical protein
MAAELAATRPCPELARAHSSAPGAHPKLAPTRPPPSLTHIKHALGGGYRCKRGGQRVARSTSPETLVGFAAARIPSALLHDIASCKTLLLPRVICSLGLSRGSATKDFIVPHGRVQLSRHHIDLLKEASAFVV